jgi:hypothetical protein
MGQLQPPLGGSSRLLDLVGMEDSSATPKQRSPKIEQGIQPVAAWAARESSVTVSVFFMT